MYVHDYLSILIHEKLSFVESLPKTSSGKIQRNLLKQQEVAKLQQIQLLA